MASFPRMFFNVGTRFIYKNKSYMIYESIVTERPDGQGSKRGKGAAYGAGREKRKSFGLPTKVNWVSNLLFRQTSFDG